MFDASKYAQHFPDEEHQFATPAMAPVSMQRIAALPSLLAALSELEKEFRAILRAQQSEPTDPAD